MKKFIVSMLVSVSFLYGGLINGIALIVNNTPITLYDIDNEMEKKDISKAEAVSILVDSALYDQEIKKYNIEVDIFDIDNYIDKIAEQNKMNSLDFKALVRQQQDYDKFTQRIKKQLIHQKLIKKIASGKLIIATNDDVKIFYQNHKNDFEIASTIDIIAYSSRNKQILNQIKKNPMIQSDKVIIKNITLKQNNLDPQLRYIINSTDTKSFTPIFAKNKTYNMFYIKDKKDITTLSLAKVKNKIFQVIMKKREQNYLKEYFDTLKITADIKVLR